MDPVDTPAPPGAPPRPSRLRTWLALALLTVALAVGGGAAWLRSDAATAWALAQVPGLQMAGVRGSVFGERLEVARLQWQAAPGAALLEVEGLVFTRPRWQWQPHAGAWLGLVADAASARQVRWTSGPPSPLAPPAHLRLPLALSVADLRVARLLIDRLPALEDLAARIALGAEGGREHRLDELRLRTDRAQIAGQVRIGTEAPLPLQLALGAQSLQGRPWSAQASARGPLNRLALVAQLRGSVQGGDPQAPALDASATVEPFAPWPLAALALATTDLDLSALAAGLPKTRIAGRATVRSAGLDQPAEVSGEFSNARPGRWDAGQLPLQRLTLEVSGTPRDLQTLEIRRFDAQLADAQGPAGRVDGQGRWSAQSLALDLRLTGLLPGRLDPRAPALTLGGPVQLALQGLPPPQALTGAAAAGAAAPWQASVQATLSGQAVGGSGPPVRLELQAEAAAHRVAVSRLLATSGGASARATLTAQRSGSESPWRVLSEGELARFDPRLWWPGREGSPWRTGPHRLDGQWQLDATLPRAAPAAGGDALAQAAAWARAPRGQASLTLRDSQLAGVAVAGTLQLRAEAEATRAELRASAAGNQLSLDGRVGADAAADRWSLDLQLPQPAALAPLVRLVPGLAAPWPTAGTLQAQAKVDGRWPRVRSEGTLQARGLRAVGLQAGTVDGRWRLGSSDDSPWDLQLDARQLQRGEQRLDSLVLRLDGTRRQHRIELSADSPLRPPAWTETLLGPAGTGTRAQMQGSAQWLADPAGGTRWLGRVASLRLGARDAGSAPRRDWFETRDLEAEVHLDAGATPTSARLAPGRATLPGGAALRWTQAQWRAGASATARDSVDLLAELEPLPVAPLLAQLQPDLGWAGDLKLGAQIVLHSQERFQADLVIERQGQAGDLRVTDEAGNPQPLGLTDLRIGLSARDGRWTFTQAAAGRQLGEMAGAVVVATTPERRWPHAQAPMDGVIEMRVANLGAWGAWVPPGWRLAGSLRTSAIFGGRFGAPELRGEVRGSGLGLRNVLQGVNLVDGELAASLEGTVARVETFRFKGGDGTLQIRGGGTLGDDPSARLTLQAEKFRMLGRVDRRLVASGSAELTLRPDRLVLDGQVAVDEGLFDFSRADAPSLDDDVNVLRPRADGAEPEAVPASARAGALPAPLRNAQVNLRIGLGEQLRLRGRGLDTLLRGDLRVTSPGGRLALNGTVTAQGGTYVAYGQRMVIERGEVSFTGSLDNPRLDIRAGRPDLDVRVGVSVAGTTQNPRVRLYSEPDMSDLDKLSWLVLGRGPDGLGRTDTALLQRAAVALLAGEGEAPTDAFLQTLGLTDFSLRQSDGEVRETVVSLGKQLSRRWYVGYERSVNATTGTWQLIYRIARRFTLRAQSGSENSLDLIWSWRW